MKNQHSEKKFEKYKYLLTLPLILLLAISMNQITGMFQASNTDRDVDNQVQVDKPLSFHQDQEKSQESEIELDYELDEIEDELEELEELEEVFGQEFGGLIREEILKEIRKEKNKNAGEDAFERKLKQLILTKMEEFVIHWDEGDNSEKLKRELKELIFGVLGDGTNPEKLNLTSQGLDEEIEQNIKEMILNKLKENSES